MPAWWKLAASELATWVLFSVVWLANGTTWGQTTEIPEPLQPWKSWATWGVKHRHCPIPFDGGENHLCFWPSRLSLSADLQRGSWNMVVRVFEETWIPLPGDGDVWPLNVNDNGEPVPVVERNGVPSVRLPSGLHQLVGEFHWDTIPQRMAIPKEIGILALVVEGSPVAIPNWDPDGFLWLKRLRSDVTDKDLLTAQVYRLIEDGTPMWLRTEIELTVSGKSREEELGWTLPLGWRLSSVESPLPTAVDESGRMKVQVRAGKWTIQLHAFQVRNEEVFQFAADARPVASAELVGFRANPELRTVEFEGIQALDVAQTTFPTPWRELPVHAWQTATPFRLVEKTRGLGLQHPEGLRIDRDLWLDADGRGFTYRDRVSGKMQQMLRLDAADPFQLGAVRVTGEGELITTNPQTGAHGVEIRRRDLQLEAIGRVTRNVELPATGWLTDADSLQVVLTLPPGWRMFALFGADRVDGDWLTAWSLLDLFLLLVFALAAVRLWGLPAGIVTLLGFGLIYHEPGAPRTTWFFLLIPVALLRVVPEGTTRRWIVFWRFVAAAILILNLVPFVARQVQGAIYPQLERPGILYAPRSMFAWLGRAYEGSAGVTEYVREDLNLGGRSSALGAGGTPVTNLRYDPATRIQTGPAVPEWSWNQVVCQWNGPVSAQQKIRPILISLSLNRFLTILRLGLLVWMAAYFFGFKKFRNPFSKGIATVIGAAAVVLLLSPATLPAQIPDPQMLETLRQRLLEPSDAFPGAGSIPQVALRIQDARLTMEVEIHAVAEAAIPLPGRLPDWSPISVQLDGKPDVTVCRNQGYLWVTVPAGVHKVVVEGWLPDVTEWPWTFLLKPHYVSLDAPGWNVSGLRPNGIPEQQLFLTRVQQAAAGETAYNQENYHAVVAVERNIQVGLVWTVHNTVTRLSTPGRAISLKVPLLKNESVLTPNAVVADGSLEVRLGAEETRFQWDSELPVSRELQLTAAETEQWVERWRLETSPAWNVTLPTLAPIFESTQLELVPTWHPWPGESVLLSFSQPQAVSGETMTVQRARHGISLGGRLRTSDLRVDLESSLGTDFNLELSPDAEVTSLKRDGRPVPVRRDGSQLKVSLHPGAQAVEVAWRSPDPIQTVTRVEPIQLPVAGSNVTTVLQIPEDRWVLWAHGPLRGPAVRFWSILAVAILAALALGSLSSSPLTRLQWVLLGLGLTQVHVSAAMLVVGWLFLLGWRGKQDPNGMRGWQFNLLQMGIVVLTLVVLGVLLVVVGEGLLGNPKMFIVGNNSSQTVLNWYEPRVTADLPEPYVISISVWFYRLLMLFWALWLATALLRWLTWGWNQFVRGGGWRRWRKERPSPAAAAT